MIDYLKYKLVLKQAKIHPVYWENIFCVLSEDTLNRLTKEGFDRRLIKPLIFKCENKIRPNKEINDLMDDANYMIKLVKNYCI